MYFVGILYRPYIRQANRKYTRKSDHANAPLAFWNGPVCIVSPRLDCMVSISGNFRQNTGRMNTSCTHPNTHGEDKKYDIIHVQETFWGNT